jgi:proteic killer suppression protein
MIVSFADKVREAVFGRRFVLAISDEVAKLAYRKLVLIHAARDLNDLRSPPGNRLEALKGNRVGQHSIRINDQWRICFLWKDGNAERVGIDDYH